MRPNLLAAGFALGILVPSVALAQETCEQRAQNRAAGTAVGALAGALLGGAVSGHHHKTEGAVIGGVAGAVIGNQAAKGPADCQHAYGWYDNRGGWHANRVDPSVAWGYYDQRGVWVAGRPADYRPVVQDWDDRERFDEGGDPEFRGFEERIRDHIREAVREDLIEPADARDLMGELRDIRRDEMAEYRDRGGRLGPDDRDRIRRRLARLDREVDRVRQEP